MLELTKKLVQRSHLVFSHLKQPGAGVSMFGKEFFLPLEGARIYLRFFGLQKGEIMEFGWKSSFNLGDDCKTGKCFLTHSLLEILPKIAF